MEFQICFLVLVAISYRFCYRLSIKVDFLNLFINRMITLYNVSFGIDSKNILKNIGLSVFDNTCIEIFGKNGTGKTSLLKIIARVQNHSSGSILYNGNNIENFEQEYRNLIFYSSHNFALHNQLTVIENLKFWANFSKKEIVIPALIHYFELDDIVETRIEYLSQGMKKRVDLSRMMLSNAKIWLLDEPFANLDEYFTNKIVNLINTLTSTNNIVFLTSNKSNNLPISSSVKFALKLRQ